jgi:predicted TIM-barrel fold metal-dependent hydrolase
MLELNHQFRIVDIHARLPGDEAADDAAERLERECRQAGVVRAAVFPETTEGECLGPNNAVARRTADRPFVAFARLSGPRSAGEGAGRRLRNAVARRGETHTSPDDVRQYAYDDRFHGFKLDPSADGLPDRETVAALGEVGLPVLVHAGEAFPPGAAVEALAGRGFPVVLAHFGGYPLREGLMADAIELLESHDELYLDTSVVRYRTVIERAVREHPDRVLFGSGAPATHPSVAVMEILSLDVPESAMRRVFSGNATRVVAALG